MIPLRSELVLIGFLCLLGILVGTVGTRAETDPPFHAQLLKVAESYTSYGRVDDEMRWAPWLCRAPLAGQARFSRSADEATHGRKLYSIFAANRNAYLAAANQPSPVGQVIIKESWVPEEVSDRKPGKPRWEDTIFSPGKESNPDRTDHFNPYAERDGKVYKAAKKGELFIMMKLDPTTPGSDDGWVYGTVSADGKTVTSAGRVASCMSCHEPRKDRLFGLRPGQPVEGAPTRPPAGEQERQRPATAPSDR
jgi:hypothetical protein